MSALRKSSCLADCSTVYLNVTCNCNQGTGYRCFRLLFNVAEAVVGTRKGKGAMQGNRSAN